MSREEEKKISDRNINPRDLGIAGSFVHDNTINESSSSDDDNIDQDNQELEVIREESLPTSEDVSESENNSTMAEEQPVTPSQLSALPTFDGERGKGFVSRWRVGLHY